MPESPPLDFVALSAQIKGLERLDAGTARSLALRLLARPSRHRLTLVRNSPRIGSPEVCRALLDLAMERRFDDVPGMLRAARLALFVAREIKGQLPLAVANDICAEAWGVLGNAERIAGDLRAARSAFGKAHKYRTAGIGDPLVTAQLFSFEGNLERRKREGANAIALFRMAHTLFYEVGNMAAAAHQLVQVAVVYADRDRHDRALNMLEQAAELANQCEDPMLDLIVVHNTAVSLMATGNLEAARGLLCRIRRHSGSNRPSAALRLQIVEARLARQLGDWESAIRLFENLHEEFAQRGFDLDALETGLELAALLDEAQERRRLRQIAEQLYPIFLSRDMPTAALGAALLFVEAVRHDTGEAGLAERALHALREARKARFERT